MAIIKAMHSIISFKRASECRLDLYMVHMDLENLEKYLIFTTVFQGHENTFNNVKLSKIL